MTVEELLMFVTAGVTAPPKGTPLTILRRLSS